MDKVVIFQRQSQFRPGALSGTKRGQIAVRINQVFVNIEFLGMRVAAPRSASRRKHRAQIDQLAET